MGNGRAKDFTASDFRSEEGFSLPYATVSLAGPRDDVSVTAVPDARLEIFPARFCSGRSWYTGSQIKQFPTDASISEQI
jgi:hypothetical protein